MSETLEETLTKLFKLVDGKRYGKYSAIVKNNEDPEKRGRLQLLIPDVLKDKASDWAKPCLPFGGGAGYGWFLVPDNNAQVWAEFEGGDVSRPIWTGIFWQQESDVPTEALKTPPTTRMLQTPSGHILQFDDEKGKETFRLHHPAEAELTIDEHGTIIITDSVGAKITLDAQGENIVVEDFNGNILTLNSKGTIVKDCNGNEIEMVTAGITVKGQQVVVQGSKVMLGGEGGEPIIKGTSFMTSFNSHVHITSTGTSGPPIPVMTPADLSVKVLTN
jgi:uncharacterized protein involved in type VI secretion and phage assembly